MAGKSTYTEEVGEKICELLIDGNSLRAICEQEGMPNRRTVLKWLNDNEQFSRQYARAREEQAESFADEIVKIADEAVEPIFIDGVPLEIEGKPFLAATPSSVAHARLKMDARKWVASKLKPKKYGEKIEHEHNGNMTVTLSGKDADI